VSTDKESFLTRWSRRKLKSANDESAPRPATAAPSAAGATAATPPGPRPELATVDSLKGLASEYRDFLHPQVEEKLRRAALKKLFHDPHFNVMDGLDVYIDDYSKPDPIPEAMLRSLVHVKGLLFDEEKKEAPPGPEKPVEDPPAIASGATERREETKAEAPTPIEPESKT